MHCNRFAHMGKSRTSQATRYLYNSVLMSWCTTYVLHMSYIHKQIIAWHNQVLVHAILFFTASIRRSVGRKFASLLMPSCSRVNSPLCSFARISQRKPFLLLSIVFGWFDSSYIVSEKKRWKWMFKCISNILEICRFHKSVAFTQMNPWSRV